MTRSIFRLLKARSTSVFYKNQRWSPGRALVGGLPAWQHLHLFPIPRTYGIWATLPRDLVSKHSTREVLSFLLTSTEQIATLALTVTLLTATGQQYEAKILRFAVSSFERTVCRNRMELSRGYLFPSEWRRSADPDQAVSRQSELQVRTSGTVTTLSFRSSESNRYWP